MATTLTAGNATTGMTLTPDNTGILAVKTGTGSGTTALTLDASQNATFAGAVSATGNITATGAITSTGATSILGYSTGAGGTVTQLTSKTTTVTLNTPTGSIITSNAALGAGVSAAFTLTNSLVTANDLFICNYSIQNNYRITGRCAAGGVSVSIKNDTGGSLSDAITINFAILKGATS